jgi:outer membrane immunogenic protein
MKNIMLAGLTLVALATAGPAVAADMPVKALVAPPVVDPWTGFYVGGNAGYSWGEWSNRDIGGSFPAGAGFTTVASPDVKGWVAGGQFGVNQLYGRWLYGLEADIQATGQDADLTGTTVTVIGPTTIALTESSHWKLPWFATFRGRLGVTVADTWLLYATGGLAVGHADYSHTSTATVTTGAASATASLLFQEGNTRVGAAVGAGIEKAIDQHWRVKAEYLYIDFGSHTFINGSGFDDVIHVHDNIARVGFNYRFLPN